jgi:hypothetical protein
MLGGDGICIPYGRYAASLNERYVIIVHVALRSLIEHTT